MQTVIMALGRYFGIVIIGIAMWFAWIYRFMQDDAFISFRYARNLARGLGIVYNPGEHVEGYTNFLWTVCMAPSYVIGVDVVSWSECLSILSFVGVLILIRRIANRWFGSNVALWALGLAAVNYSFCAYATGGLETMFGIFWMLLVVDSLASGHIAFAALATVASFMTRMDSSLILFPFWVAAFFRDGIRNPRWHDLFVGSIVVLPLVAVWLYCRHEYYGAWLPNTFLIKGDVSPIRGMMYVGMFHVLYGFVVVLPFLFMRRIAHVVSLPALVSILLWHLYLIMVGGDFMEFRLFLPCFPMLAIITAKILSERCRLLLLVLLVMAIVGLPRFMPSKLVQPIHDLKSYHDEMMDYANELKSILGPDVDDVKIAITCAGILPYVTDLPTLDLLGLNDRDVAIKGKHILPAHGWLGNRPGHCRIATWDMVVEKRVNLLINYAWMITKAPRIMSSADLNQSWPRFHVEMPSSSSARLILWPMANGAFWPMVYVTPHPSVDSAIMRHKAIVIELDGKSKL